ncbi:hypothetical protein CWATWH0003_2656 [Crocosphaera watsonii WH 0003]|uniref:Uncharacterized protein n=1 Tax=Crocosphaera watsonii WH 0003 TaxID=423471 RepID=G5J591_CROWT|nr:hypothetical protein CWATWH0003_2656 [Crocosphaera watsonii WH 0003]
MFSCIGINSSLVSSFIDYIRNYIQLHRIHQLDVAVVSAFWEHIPPEKKVLLEWERELILKYRSPFKKECK